MENNINSQYKLDSISQIPIYTSVSKEGIYTSTNNIEQSIYNHINKNISNYGNINNYFNNGLPNNTKINNINNNISNNYFLEGEAPPVASNSNELGNNDLIKLASNSNAYLYNKNIQSMQVNGTNSNVNFYNQIFNGNDIGNQIIKNDFNSKKLNKDLNKSYEPIEFNENTFNEYNGEFISKIENKNLFKLNESEFPLSKNNNITNINSNISHEYNKNGQPSINNLSLDINDDEIKKKLDNIELSKSYIMINNNIPLKSATQPKEEIELNIIQDEINVDKTLQYTNSFFPLDKDLNSNNHYINNNSYNYLTYNNTSISNITIPTVYNNQTEIIPLKEINNQANYMLESQEFDLPLINPVNNIVYLQNQDEIITPQNNIVKLPPKVYSIISPSIGNTLNHNLYYSLINQNIIRQSISPQIYNTFTIPVNSIISPLSISNVNQIVQPIQNIPLDYNSQSYINLMYMPKKYKAKLNIVK